MAISTVTHSHRQEFSLNCLRRTLFLPYTETARPSQSKSFRSGLSPLKMETERVLVRNLSLLTRMEDIKANGYFDKRCYVELGSREADKAVELNGRVCMYHKVEIVVADGKPEILERKVVGHRAFVYGLNKDQGEYEIYRSLEKHFSFCGNVEKIKISKDKLPGRVFKQCGFKLNGSAVEKFSTPEAVEAAVKLDHSPLGDQVRVLSQDEQNEISVDLP